MAAIFKAFSLFRAPSIQAIIPRSLTKQKTNHLYNRLKREGNTHGGNGAGSQVTDKISVRHVIQSGHHHIQNAGNRQTTD
jgi:hypothetical protein